MSSMRSGAFSTGKSDVTMKSAEASTSATKDLEMKMTVMHISKPGPASSSINKDN